MLISVIPSVAVAAASLVSVLPIVSQHVRSRAQLFVHILLGFFHFLLPSFFLAATVQGEFNTLHSFLQAFIAPIHIGLAYFLYATEGERCDQSHVFSRVLVSLLSLCTRLFAAWHLSEKSTRGLLISDHFLLCTILTDGLWFVTELIRFMQNKRTMQDEVDAMCKRTTLWLEGKGSFYLENALYFDAGLCFIQAMFHYAFPNHILKLVIRSEHVIDSHHVMWCRLYGVICLLPAVSSLAARHFPPHILIPYLGSRLISQIGVFVLNIWGHWVQHVYSANHISAFMVCGFYMSFLFSAYYRSKKHFAGEDNKRVVTARIETQTIRKTK